MNLLNFWFGRQIHLVVETHPILQRCVEQRRTYDYVILMPHDVLPVVQIEDSPLSQRNLADWPHYLSSIRILSFAHQYLTPQKTISVPADVPDKDERVDFVIQASSTS